MLSKRSILPYWEQAISGESYSTACLLQECRLKLAICDSDEGRAEAIAGQFGVRTISISDETACTADVILLAVPPKAVPDLFGPMGKWLRPGQLVVSFAAATLLARLGSLPKFLAKVATTITN